MSHKQLILIIVCTLLSSYLVAQRSRSKPSWLSRKEKASVLDEPKSAFGSKERQDKRVKSEPKSAFATKSRKKSEKKHVLPDFYARSVKELAERNQLPSFFATAIEKERARTEQPDFFAKGIFKTQYSEPADHFGRSSQKKAGKQKDSQHFASKPDSKKPSEDDVQHRVRSRNKTYTRFVGERFALFSRDPNARANKQRKQRFRRQRDSFGRDARETQQAQNPRGEMDLFQGGVLPKMKDLR